MFKSWSAHWRMTFLYMLVFMLSVTTLGAVVYAVTQEFLKNQMTQQIEVAMEQLLVDYDQDGLEELRHDTEERVEQNHPGRLWYTLWYPDGRTEFDVLPKTLEEGWHVIPPPENLLVKVINIRDGHRFAVGMSLHEANALERAVRNTFLIILFGTLILGLVGGQVLSRRFFFRIEQIRKTAESIGSGELSNRIPLSDYNDDFDRLAVIMNRMLERIEQLVGEIQQVSTSIAHDLRTPLGRIRHKLEHLSGDLSLGEIPQKEVDSTIQILDETLETFSALLRIAEIKSGVRRSGFGPVDLSALLEDLADTYSVVGEEEGREITKVIEKGITIQGDRSLLTQLYANLIENSLRHTPVGTKIVVQLRRMAEGVESAVTDNGPGIKAEHQQDVFKPFFRGDNSRSTQGSGLGLSLVSAIAKLHEAHLSLESQNGLTIKVEFA